jgi:tRNA-dihydrouridine synthase B
MISADAVSRQQARTLRMIDIAENEHPVGIQLFGASPDIIANAVRMVTDFKPDLIDLNFGCPVKKVIRKNGGAALLNDLPRADEIMLAAVENSRIPVTIKIRTGWDLQNEVYLELGKLAEKRGVSAITLHPRNRTQNYSVKADWRKIGYLKKEVSIPVIGNGDIESCYDAEKMLNDTGCDAVMIGRAAMKNPFIFTQIKTYFNSGNVIPDMTIPEKIDMALKHTNNVISQYGDSTGAKMMRKHLLWYTKGFQAGAVLRKQLMMVSSLSEIEYVLKDYLSKY